MTKSKMANRYSPEVRARAVRMVFEHQVSYETQAAAIAAIALKIGCIPQTSRGWVLQAEKDSGMRDGVTTEERDRIKTPERENRKRRQANEILRKASAYFAPALIAASGDCRAVGRNSTAAEAMTTFIDDQRVVYGVESICKVLPIAPSLARQSIRSIDERGHIITDWRAKPIRPKLRPGISGIRSCAQRSSVSGMSIIRPTGCARHGTS